jgi:hypothetical protein
MSNPFDHDEEIERHPTLHEHDDDIRRLILR